jgi:Outer membrane protein beta-barrel domain
MGILFNLNLSLTPGKIHLTLILDSMKQLFTLFLALFITYSLSAQDSTTVKRQKRDWSKINMSNRPNDHFMLQLGYNGWSQKPDTIQTKGLSRSFNMYFMFDFPFKTDPRFSVGIGAGVGSDNVFFTKTIIDITGRNANTLGFKNVSDTNYFKRYKLNTTFVEAPVELRFSANPANSNKSWKIALGAKVGTMLSAHTKGKNLLNKSGGVINSYTDKEKSKRYFNGTRLSVTGRIGYGVLGIYGSYQINSFVKEGFGPDVKPFQIGISISGL